MITSNPSFISGEKPARWLIKGCPRCDGALFIEDYPMYDCLQCGNRVSLVTLLSGTLKLVKEKYIV